MNSRSRAAITRGSPSSETQPAKSTARFSIRDHGSNAAYSHNKAQLTADEIGGSLRCSNIRCPAARDGGGLDFRSGSEADIRRPSRPVRRGPEAEVIYSITSSAGEQGGRHSEAERLRRGDVDDADIAPMNTPLDDPLLAQPFRLIRRDPAQRFQQHVGVLAQQRRTADRDG